MVQKFHPWGIIWVPSIPPHAGHLSEKNDDQLSSMKMSMGRMTYNLWNFRKEGKLLGRQCQYVVICTTVRKFNHSIKASIPSYQLNDYINEQSGILRNVNVKRACSFIINQGLQSKLKYIRSYLKLLSMQSYASVCVMLKY